MSPPSSHEPDQRQVPAMSISVLILPTSIGARIIDSIGAIRKLMVFENVEERFEMHLIKLKQKRDSLVTVPHAGK